MTTSTVTTVKVNATISNKVINAAAKGIAKRVNDDAKKFKNERKTLKATISALAASDSVEAQNFREFLNLKKNANKNERNAVCAWVEMRYIYVTRKVYVTTGDECDAVNVEISGLMPCSKNGKAYNDILDAVKEIRKVYEITLAKRKAIANEMKKTRAALIATGCYHERIGNVLSYVNRAPRKLHKQIILGDTVIRK